MLNRMKNSPRVSFCRVSKTVFMVLVFLASLSMRRIQKEVPNPVPEFEHYLQRDFVYQLNQSQKLNRLKHSSQGWNNDLLKVYENQLHQYQTTAVLPIFQNDRLQFHLNRNSLIKLLFGQQTSISSSTRDLCINCLVSDGYQFNFTIRFQRKSSNSLDSHVQWTLNQPDSTVFHILSSTSDNIHIVIRQQFSRQTTFQFSYQWLDSISLHRLSWPVWPLQKSCLLQRGNHSCLKTDLLQHSSSRDLFLAEQSAIQHWLDIQYDATFSSASTLQQKQPRRLVPFEIKLKTNVCSSEFITWIEQYHLWHENIIHRMMTNGTFEDFIFDHNLRFLVYRTMGSGTADRILHLITTYLIAIITKRVFLFDHKWSDFSETMQSALNDNSEEILSWISSPAVLRRIGHGKNPKRITSRTHHFGLDRLTKDFDYEKLFRERIVMITAHTGGIAPMISSNTSLYRKLLTKDLHLTIENIFGCLYHSFIIHRLSALIERTSQNVQHTFGHSAQQLLQILLSPDYFPIGIQVRTGDGFLKSDNESRPTPDKLVLKRSANYIGCARRWSQNNAQMLMKNHQIPVAFLISDTVRLRRAVLRRWQYPSSCFRSSNPSCPNSTSELHFIANPDQILHVAYTNQRSLAFNLAMFDTFLFGLCEQHLITHDSGFGRIGVFAALKPRNIFSFSPKEYLYCSNDNETILLLQSSNDWSGI